MSVKFQILLTPELLKAGVRQFWIQRYIRKRELFLSFILATVLILFGVMRGHWIIAVFLGVYLFSFWIPRASVYFILMRKKKEQFDRLTNGTAGLILTDSKVVLDGALVRSEIKWEELKGIVINRSVLLLLWGGMDFSIIPANALSAEAVSLIKQKAHKVATIG